MLIKASKFTTAEQAEKNFKEYLAGYKESLEKPDEFWAKQAERLYWHKKWDVVKNATFSPEVSIKWFEGGKLNACYNCVDRHLKDRGGDTAIIWESDSGEQVKKITYAEVYEQVCRIANVMKKHGVKKGDRVTIYMPMIPEAVFSMLACARIGAVHSVVFGGFSADSLRSRMDDCKSNFIITADEGVRGGRFVPLKKNVDDALKDLERSVKVLVFKHTSAEVAWQNGRDLWYHEECDGLPSDCPPEIMDAEDPLFILYTSGSTGKPKGVLHTTGGYLLYASLTHEKIFGYKRGDIYWCTADVGWITGHSYLVYGPLANGATTLVFEGVPSYPTPSRIWQTVDRHQVNILYTAPTLIRALEKEGDKFVKATSRKSLKLLGSVGEPINPEVWMWYFRVCGDDHCPVVDTWWQTETGGILISPLPEVTDLKPGSATLPFFGVDPVIVDQSGNVMDGVCEGALCIKGSWPGQMRTVFGDHNRFKETYFSQFSGLYFSGDGAKRDEDGYYWITGRMDDVIKISGHRIGTAEVESALVLHEAVSEAAVVGFPHEIKGQGIYAFVTLSSQVSPGAELEKQLKEHVAKHIGAIARPDVIQWAPNLPKTRSGKIMRRILRKIAEGEFENLGDTSTLLSPEAVTELIAGRKAA